MAESDLLEDGALSIDGAAKFLAISRTALYRLANAGEIQLIKVGFRTVVAKRSAVEFLRRSLEATRQADDQPKVIAAPARRAREERRRLAKRERRSV